jgi:hypothetical protein
MANYLNRLVSRLGGETLAVRPRVRGRFEPAEKGSQLAAIPLLSETSEESLNANPAPARPLRSVASSFSEETPRATFAPHIVKERDIRSEIAVPPVASSPEELRPNFFRGARRELHSDNSSLDKNSSLHEERQALPEIRPKAHSTSLEKSETRETSLSGLRILREIQPRDILRIEKTNDSADAKKAIRFTDSKREESPSARESLVDAGLARPAITQPVAVRKTEQRAAPNQLPQDIQIVIGKITVQANFPAQQAAPLPTTRPGPKLTLEQYLQQREGRR